MKVILKELPVQKALTIRRSVRAENLSHVLGEIFGKVWKHIAATGTQLSGPAFTRYHATGDIFDIEAGFPVTEAKAAGEIKLCELPSGPVAFVSYFGPYEKLMQGHRALAEWMEEEGFEPASSHWEVYVSDPGTEPDPNNWRTDIFQPVAALDIA